MVHYVSHSPFSFNSQIIDRYLVDLIRNFYSSYLISSCKVGIYSHLKITKKNKHRGDNFNS